MNINRLATLALVCTLILTGCQHKDQRYKLRGQVLEKNPASSEITVKHEEIPDFMAAMTMPYEVKDAGALREVQPGDLIEADVVTANNQKEYWLENVRITDTSGRVSAKAGTVHHLDIGERVPEFPLTNQDGKTFHLADFRGKAVLVSFIYTRCPMPNFCPRLSSQFAKIREDLSKIPDDYGKIHLLSISFDPKYDTSAVLRKYGLAYLDNDPAGFSHWEFAFTDPGNLRRLADAFGLEYFDEGDSISHTMVIVLIAPDGTIARYWGTRWTTQELEDALRQQAQAVVSTSSGRKGTAAK